MQIHDLKRKTKRVKHRQVGRGGKRGKTSGRGTKGQKARAGRKLRPEIRDMIKKLPKMRGRGIHPNKAVGLPISSIGLATLNENFNAGDKVSPKILVERALIRRVDGRIPQVKILASGELSKGLQIARCIMSVSAREKIVTAGGSIK